MGWRKNAGNSKAGGKPINSQVIARNSRPETQPVLAVALSIIFFITMAIAIVPLVEAADPGHPASSVSAGTFESGNFIFPVNLTVNKFFIANGSTLYVDALNGNVGIGTTDPQGKLDVNGDIVLNGGTFGGFTYGSSPISNARIYSGSGRALILDAGGIGGNHVTILTSGNVGIGTASPTKKLEVSNSTQSITFDPTVAAPTINTTAATNLTITSSGGNVIIQLG